MTVHCRSDKYCTFKIYQQLIRCLEVKKVSLNLLNRFQNLDPSELVPGIIQREIIRTREPLKAVIAHLTI